MALAIALPQSSLVAQAETQRVTPAVRSPGAGFGETVALSGRTMVVGAPGAGTAHVFEYVRDTGWMERQTLLPDGPVDGSRFGACVTMDGDLLAIGAPGEDAAYLLSRRPDGTFQGMTRVAPAVPQPGASFGRSLALRDGRLAVGSPWQDARTGAVHLFERRLDGSVAPVAALRPTGVSAGDELGFAVAFDDDGTTLFASAVQDDDGAMDGGAVYVLADTGSGFVTVQKLVAPDAAVTDRAGRVLACSGDLLVVGVRNDDDGGRESGSVTLWERSGGTFTYAGKLLAPDRAVGDLFGHSVALRGDSVLVGAMAKDQSGFVLDVGRAYLFERSAAGPFAFVRSFDSTLPQHTGRFGSAVALGVTGLAIGGVGADGGAGEVLAAVEPPSVDPSLSGIDVSAAEIAVGEEVTVTVVVRDELGEPLAGATVVIETTLGRLVGTVVDTGDGRYTQQLLGDVPGTAEIGATVDGMALTAVATLTVRDPRPSVRVAAQREDGSWLPFDAIQPAIDAAATEALRRILVAPGTYEEVVRIEGRERLALTGLTSFGLVTVRGLRISGSHDVVVEGLHVQPGERGCGGVSLATGDGNERVVLQSLFVDGTRDGCAGVRIESGNRHVLLESCHVVGSSGDGVRVSGPVTALTLRDCTVRGSLGNGVVLGPRVRDVRILASRMLDNGRMVPGRGGYGILRHGGGASARPEDVTLIRNELRDNHGRAQTGRSTADLGRYDLMLDAADDQAVGAR